MLKLNQFTNNQRKIDSVVQVYKNTTIYKCNALKQDLLNTIKDSTQYYYSTVNKHPVTTIAEAKRDIDVITKDVL